MKTGITFILAKRVTPDDLVLFMTATRSQNGLLGGFYNLRGIVMGNSKVASRLISQEKCPYCLIPVRLDRIDNHVNLRCPKKPPQHKQFKPLSTQIGANIVCEICRRRFNDNEYYNLHLRYEHNAKKCKLCGQSINLQNYQPHLNQHHAEDIQKCPYCDEEVFLIELSSHQKQECKAIIKKLCKDCGDEILMLYFDLHLDWHVKQQQNIIRANNHEPAYISKNAQQNIILGNSNICRYCGRSAIPSEGVCYYCAGTMK